MHPKNHACIIDKQSFAEMAENRQLILFGSGADKLEGILQHRNIRIIHGFELSARYLVPLSNAGYYEAKFENVAYFETYYLKDFITTKPRKKWL